MEIELIRRAVNDPHLASVLTTEKVTIYLKQS